ncbi:MAG TPA: hypothetical protein VFM71_09315 [Gemmatimonadaceae bacterium]|nr:hypothetical protein [Gemmatimonadaceae bacterium]
MTIVRVCTRDDPTVACAERYEAVRRGAFWFSLERQGWLWSGAASVVDPWDCCPWCGGELPTLTSATLRALEAEDRQADGWEFYDRYEGEDGG